jgi:serine phosphatase RsbU (regulator of sigma subunit)
MSAAMTVSLLVGTLRTQAHCTQRPAEILSAMNERMVSRSRGGFTTCLVMKAEADGLVTLANAGHIAPYLIGTEVPVEGTLPLGLSADTVYAESTFILAEDMQLTLITDGVVEARNRNGELFGFERTSDISVQSAASIAHVAQQFGQEDDITVVTVTRKPVTHLTQPVPFRSTS